LKNKKTAFIGVGNMAGAMMMGALRANYLSCDDVIMFDTFKAQYDKYNRDGVNIKIAESVTEAAQFADCIVLGVKPQSDIAGILSEISVLDLENKTIVSILAGVKIENLVGLLAKEAGFVRVMPNTPFLVGRGVSAMCRNEFVGDDDFSFVEGLLKSGGSTIFVDEVEINKITAITSSAVAYIALFAKAMADGARDIGFDNADDETLQNIVSETIFGSTQLMLDLNMTPESLIKMVASPNGTTEKALKVFDEKEFTAIISEAMTACKNRADELSSV